jgi:hypothetical protein
MPARTARLNAVQANSFPVNRMNMLFAWSEPLILSVDIFGKSAEL